MFDICCLVLLVGLSISALVFVYHIFDFHCGSFNVAWSLCCFITCICSICGMAQIEALTKLECRNVGRCIQGCVYNICPWYVAPTFDPDTWKVEGLIHNQLEYIFLTSNLHEYFVSRQILLSMIHCFLKPLTKMMIPLLSSPTLVLLENWCLQLFILSLLLIKPWLIFLRV